MGVEIMKIDQLIDDEERSVRLAAAEALVTFEGDAALERIIDFAFANEGYHRLEAGQLLRQIGAVKANPPLIAVIEDENRRREWQVAIEVLGTINSSNIGQ
jgi:HEAT repeat protein